MDKQIVISIKTILLTLLVFLSIYVVYRLGPVIGILLVATLMVFAVEPAVQKLTKLTIFNKPLKRSIAVIITYVFLILFFALVITMILPPVLEQVQKLFNSLDTLLKNFGLIESNFDGSIKVSSIIPNLGSTSGDIISSVASVFTSFTTVTTLVVFSIYMSLDWINIKERFVLLFSERHQGVVEDTINDIESNVGHWVKGQLLLMLIIGVLSFVGLLIIGVRYPLALGLVSGLLEIVPIMGPFISAVLAGIIGFADSPIKGIGAIALFTLIQQLENNLIVPKIMQKVSGFSPLIILLALLIGSEFFGIVGAIIAVPVTMILTIVVKRLLSYSEE